MTDHRHDQSIGYVPFDPSDTRWSGAEAVIDAERDHIRQRQDHDPDGHLAGLAISGGGIRSASFALGMLQALAWQGKLGRFDYLSTVSGGGYIGSSLTWLLHRYWPKSQSATSPADLPSDCDGQQPATIHFGVEEPCFPYGARERTAQADQGVRVKSAILRHLRQNASYLNPGNGITVFSLLAVVLRGLLVSLAIYLPLLVMLQYALIQAGAFEPGLDTGLNYAALAAAALAVIFAVWALLYAVLTCLARTGQSRWYFWRRLYETWAGRALIAIAGLLVIAVIPWVADTGLRCLAEWLTGVPEGEPARYVAIASSVLGALFGGGAYSQAGRSGGGTRANVLAVTGAALLIFGLLLGAYLIAKTAGAEDAGIALLVAISGLLLGHLANINFISIHRYYRDRLMETFMPGVPEVYAPNSGPSPDADRGWLRQMCAYPGTAEAQADTLAQGPYHIVNTNLILVDSKIKKFKARGGDNFILSPLYCGSNATGWRSTREFMGGNMTLATAMAISGAAATPNTGPGGSGLTRNPMVSFLMALLNLRLGYWVPHPDPEVNRKSSRPNFLWPGLGELFRFSLNERSQFANLSDGGHFENLALYELIRRRVDLIVCTDGGADPKFQFSDFANLIEKVRVDLGVRITDPGQTVGQSTGGVDVSPLVPSANSPDASGNPTAQSGCVLADIHYPDQAEPGKLLYIKTTWLKDMPGDLLGYKNDHPEFPDQSTADQFFDERQFEAHRELGHQIGLQALQTQGLPNWF